ncbi:MAG: gyrase, subunit [Myxococcales bacterium]|nr:gyrase, subunit [Myxococcales bacterium]
MSDTPPPPAPFAAQRTPVAIEDEMKSSFMDYAMSVIISRALPDVRDGLKPVHRRIMFTQHQLNNNWNRPYLKSARVVGDCMGKFHPHGDASIYDAVVRMAQDFSLRYPLADGQGNWGSIDGDPAAAMRYTEVRMTRLGAEMLADIDKETIEWQKNYDDKEDEPTVLPTRVPNLLINGTTGIAVGMATNIPPHNVTEVIDGTIALIDDPTMTVDQLMHHIPGPDLPTSGTIFGRQGIRLAYHTGRGSIVMRGKAEIEEDKRGRSSIIVTEIPYMVIKARLVEKVAELVKEKRLEGISDIRDESNRKGMRIVFELRKDAVPAVVLNNLYKMTQLQSSFGVTMLAIVDSQPKILSLKDALSHFVDHRRDVVTRRSLFELKEARARQHVVEGLVIAVDNIDRVIQIIRAANTPEEAKANLMAEPLAGLDEFLRRAGRSEEEILRRTEKGDYALSDRQAQAILDMRLQRLTGLEREKLDEEYRALSVTIDRLEAILASEEKLMQVIKDELIAIRDQFGDERRTQIVDDEGEIAIEELIADEDMVVTVSHGGYVKRNSVSAYRSQKRGGRGVTGASTKDEDFVSQLFVASTHDHILMFTSLGRVYAKRVYELPEGSRASRGKALVNFLELRENEKVVEMLALKEFEAGKIIVMATRRGVVKKTPLEAFSAIRSSGIIALTIDADDHLVEVRLTDGQHDVLLATREGRAIRFPEEKVRPMGRTARGVKGIALREKDEVVSCQTFPRNAPATLMTVCEHGYGKRTAVAEYPVKGRGGLGVITIKTTERNGKVVGCRLVTDDEDLMLITDAGKVIRIPVKGIPTLGRNTQGVRLVRMDEGENVVAVESLAEREDEAGEVQAAPIEVIEGEEDLSGDDDDDTVQVKTQTEDDDGEGGNGGGGESDAE